jgi:steroid delta-isomerase-like uncharacterized protein
MSERTELANRLIEAFTALDLEEAQRLCAADVRLSTLFDGPGVEPFAGHEGLRQWFARLEHLWSSLEVSDVAYEERGDWVLGWGRARLRGRESAGEVESEFGSAVEIARGVVVFAGVYGRREEAAAEIERAVRDLRSKREAIVIEHMESENRHEFEVTLDTFEHPRYELIATGDVHDGPEEVAAYFEETRTAFPDQRNELIALHHADDAVIVEAMLYGTHEGPLRGLPPTGRKFEMRFCAMFLFEEDRLVCERVYFDAGTILRQLGIAHDPLTLKGRLATLANHPLTVGRAVARQVLRR